MREIKFRAWDNHIKEYSTEEIFISRNGDALVPIDGWDLNDNEVYEGRLEIEQFTGVQDKNDVDIYEGDIVFVCMYRDDIKHDGKHFMITWSKDKGYPSFEFYPKDVGWEANPISQCHYSYEVFEVVGNIHQNPELLKGEL